MVSWLDPPEYESTWDESLRDEHDREALESLDRREAEDEWPE